LRAWHAQGHGINVYSSGSVAAQRLFFGYSAAGDLTSLVSNWYDTEVGGKREAESYRRIVESLGVPAADVLFLSDVVEELDAAREAGLDTVLLDRREDYPQPRQGDSTHGHRRVESFADVAPERA
jgi:enolase-phosphatase E1